MTRENGRSGRRPQSWRYVPYCVWNGVLVRQTGFAIWNTSFYFTKGWRRLAFVGFFLGLFAFSGDGFLTSSMLLIEGPDIARSAISDCLRIWASRTRRRRN